MPPSNRMRYRSGGLINRELAVGPTRARPGPPQGRRPSAGVGPRRAQRAAQLRRTNTQTGEIDQVLIPCGATLASICPPCAERAKQLRAAQCREGWHLDE